MLHHHMRESEMSEFALQGQLNDANKNCNRGLAAVSVLFIASLFPTVMSVCLTKAVSK